MEHSKLIAFSLKCDICSRAWSVSEDDLAKHIVKCQNPNCDNEFTVYEGIRNGLKAEEHITPNSFLASDMYVDNIQVKIGYSLKFELPEEVTKENNAS